MRWLPCLLQGLIRRLEGDPLPEITEDTSPAQLAAGLLQESGFREVAVVRGTDAGRSLEKTRRELGFALPLRHLSAAGLVAAVGKDHQVRPQ